MVLFNLVSSYCIQICVSHSVIFDSSPGSSILGILQARILEWVAISFPVYIDSVCILKVTDIIKTFRVTGPMSLVDWS